MSIVKFYRGDPKNAPKTTMPAHLGANAIITCNGKLLLEKRRDSDTWGLVGGGCGSQEDLVHLLLGVGSEDLLRGSHTGNRTVQSLYTVHDLVSFGFHFYVLLN